MSKATLVTIKLEPNDKSVVSKGKKIIIGDSLVKSFSENIISINLKKILNINPKHLEKYLIVKPGTQINQHDIIAEKKSVLKKEQIKAPISGKFEILDKDQGIVIIKNQIESSKLITSWFDGEVKDVMPDKIIFSVNGESITGVKGKGKLVKGKLQVIGESISIYDLPIDLKSQIIAIKNASSDIVAKADALGALAIIAETLEQPPFSLPFIIISDIASISKFHKQDIMLFGDEKQILILSSS
jgi:hypothetical protein